ncbi:hypothetical protein FQA39_LY15703 [Lamprigera yunnana]|nr:hypothetical protein FQA39_LY15703 [Lamprigera yunnana]
MCKFTGFVFLLILHLAKGRHSIIIAQLLNNVEIPLNSTRFMASFGENLTFHCYVNMKLRNNTHVHKNVVWSSSSFHVHKNEKDQSVLNIPGVNYFDEGQYNCKSDKYRLLRSFHLYVIKYDINRIDFADPNEFDHIMLHNRAQIPLSNFSIGYMPNFTNIKLPEITYNKFPRYGGDKSPIFVIPGVIIIIVGLVRMCYYLKREKIPWEHLTSPVCNHQLCEHHRRRNANAGCLLQGSESNGTLSILIVPRVPETDNPTDEADVPPVYSDVSSQDSPPSYNEAVQNMKPIADATSTNEN